MMLISADKCDKAEANKAFHDFFAFHWELRHVGLDHAGSSAFFPDTFGFGSREGQAGVLSPLPKLDQRLTSCMTSTHWRN